MYFKVENTKKIELFEGFMNIKKDNDLFANYFDKFRDFLLNNSLKILTKEVIEFKF